jgi:hypothetical protein
MSGELTFGTIAAAAVAGLDRQQRAALAAHLVTLDRADTDHRLAAAVRTDVAAAAPVLAAAGLDRPVTVVFEVDCHPESADGWEYEVYARGVTPAGSPCGPVVFDVDDTTVDLLHERASDGPVTLTVDLATGTITETGPQT